MYVSATKIAQTIWVVYLVIGVVNAIGVMRSPSVRAIKAPVILQILTAIFFVLGWFPMMVNKAITGR